MEKEVAGLRRRTTRALIILALRARNTFCHLSNSAPIGACNMIRKAMTEQELRPLIVQLYAELITRINARIPNASDESEIAEGAEMLANQIILDIKQAGELDDLLSLSPEEIRELFNKSDFRGQQ